MNEPRIPLFPSSVSPAGPPFGLTTVLPHETSPRSAMRIHNFLSPEECEFIINGAECLGFEDSGYVGEIRKTLRIKTFSEDMALLLFERARHLLKPIVIERGVAMEEGVEVSGIESGLNDGIWNAVALNPGMRLCKYVRSGHFRPHFDYGHNPSEQIRSLKTFMIYLNSGFTGGNTRFFDERQKHYKEPNPEFVIAEFVPEQGSVLCFNSRITHDGGELLGGMKYLLRSEVLYQWQPMEK